MIKYYFILAAAVLLNTAAQNFYKYASHTLAVRIDESDALPEKIKILLSNSHAYPFLAASFVWVALAGHFSFSEPLTLSKIVGAGLIAVGIAVSA